MNNCLFCPDNIPEYSLFLTAIFDKHHIQGRTRSRHVIPVCRYHHTRIHDGKISKSLIVERANRYFGEERFILSGKRILENGDCT